MLFTVQAIVWLALKKEAFDAKNQSKFLHALAAAVETSDEMVEIVSIVQSQRRYRRNSDSAIGANLIITADIMTVSSTEAAMRASILTPEALSKYLSKEQLPMASLQSVSILNLDSQQDSERSVLVKSGIGVGVAVIISAVIVVLWRRRQNRLRQLVSRRLIGAKSGMLAEQSDLPFELRAKYAAVKVLGCGAFGVVLEAWQLNNGRRVVQRAVKLVHARGRIFTQTETRRLEREVCACNALGLLPTFML
jgi:hypothetical protein